MKRKPNILVACEESQAITKALISLGFKNVYSCDLLPCSGGLPENHFQTNVFDIIRNKGGITQANKKVTVEKWDMMIAHPPCTYLAVSGAKWYYHPEDKGQWVKREHPRFKGRYIERDNARKFFEELYYQPIEKIAIENPIGIMSSVFRKPDQIVQPFMFGDEARKTTCLWLKGLPNLEIDETKRVGEGERIYFKSGKSQPKWYSDALVKAKSSDERRTLRSKTFPGMAKAMAEQWTRDFRK